MAGKTSIKSAKVASPGERGNSKAASKIRFSATLLRPKATVRAFSWTFLTLPKEASAKLPSRSMTSVEGTFHGLAFQATLEPDGQGGHWLKVLAKGNRRPCCFDRSGMYAKSLSCPVADDTSK